MMLSLKIFLTYHVHVTKRFPDTNRTLTVLNKTLRTSCDASAKRVESNFAAVLDTYEISRVENLV